MDNIGPWSFSYWPHAATTTITQDLHNNRIKFPKDFFAIVLSTNMAAMTSDAIKEWKPRYVKTQNHIATGWSKSFGVASES